MTVNRNPTQKVLIYLTRSLSTSTDLLVFEHQDIPSAGLQVPAGTIEEYEEPGAAAKRELLEESGLVTNSPPISLGSYPYYREDIDEHQIRHVFHLETSEELPETWVRRVSGKGADTGLVFKFFWLPVKKAEMNLAGNQGLYLEKIKK